MNNYVFLVREIMPIIHNLNCALVHIPKTGGTTIISVLSGKYTHSGADKIAYDTGPHQDALQIKQALGNRWNRYYKIVFVRNPWDRAVSLYARRQDLTFKEFIARFHNSTDYASWAKKKPKRYYLDWIFDKDGGQLVDFVGRFETLEDDLKKVCKKLGVKPKKIPRLQSTKHKHYTEYYDKEDENIIRQRFDRDIEYFGYKFGS